MRLLMVGMDHTTTPLLVREGFSIDAEACTRILARIPGAGVTGAAILSTCNRTELYITHTQISVPDAAVLLCRALDKDVTQAEYFVCRVEDEAAEHLLRVAAGLESGVLGDSQIISQVRTAIETARSAGTANPLLEALFRAAVTAGKIVRTNIRFSGVTGSAAKAAVLRLHARFGSLEGKKGLVIGSGIIGRCAAEELLQRGCTVWVARRRDSGSPPPPKGSAIVDYDDRYALLSGCDLVISATAAQGYTLTADGLASVRGGPLPEVFVDLAVPRDIDPEIEDRIHRPVWNIDSLEMDGVRRCNRDSITAAEALLAPEVEKFAQWRRNYRRRTGQHGNLPDFPLFINLAGARVVILGGGRVAARRAAILLGFGARITVISPQLCPEMEKLVNNPGLVWHRREYADGDIVGATLVIAATDTRDVNHRVSMDARSLGIFVSAADCREDCTFFFPALLQSDCLTAGLVSNNGDHAMVKKAAAVLRREMEAFDENYTRGEP